MRREPWGALQRCLTVDGRLPTLDANANLLCTELANAARAGRVPGWRLRGARHWLHLLSYHHERVTPHSIGSGLARPPQGPWRYRGVRFERFVCRVDFPLVLALSAEVTQGAANIVVKHGAMCLAHRTLDGVRAVRGWLVIVRVRHRKTRALSSATCSAARTSSVHHVANEPESLDAMAVP